MPPARHNGAVVPIEVWLSTPQQLFNSFDPSPFHDKDLDREAEEYIVGSADEVPLAQHVRLLIHLPSDQVRLAQSLGLERAVHNYFAYRQGEMRRRLRFQFREGRIALSIGVGFLVACISARQLAGLVAGDTFGRILQEGLLILGWVAMWRPLQILLYDWWPILHRAQLFGKLARMPVEILPSKRMEEVQANHRAGAVDPDQRRDAETL